MEKAVVMLPVMSLSTLNVFQSGGVREKESYCYAGVRLESEHTFYQRHIMAMVSDQH
jgi:hypothetical protein